MLLKWHYLKFTIKKELSVEERINSSIDLLGNIADINNRIQTLSGLVTEENVENNNK